MAQPHNLSTSNLQTASDLTTKSSISFERQATPRDGRSPKKIPDKCVSCALLSMAEVRSLHGATGNGCYVSEVCRSRRSHARHCYQRNQTRRQKWYEAKVGVDVNPVVTQVTAQLIVYREPRYNVPVDGIAAIVRQGKTKLAVVQPK